MESIKSKKIRKSLRLIAPSILGIIGGYLYYNFIGCNNGCAITSNPYSSMIWGGIIGLFLTNFNKEN
jgi:hypothetical protein